MVNKQYKIQQTLDNTHNNLKSTKRHPNSKFQFVGVDSSAAAASSSTKQNKFGVNKKNYHNTDNTPLTSLTSYESVGTNYNIGNNFSIRRTQQQQQQQQQEKLRNNFDSTKLNFSNNFESFNFQSTNPSSIESVYGQNISMSYGGGSSSDETMGSKKNQKYSSRGRHNSDQFDDLTINDIGRFQYILQMDKELGTYPESYYHLSPQNHQNQSQSITVNDMKSSPFDSAHNQNSINFWKAGSESDYPIKKATTTSSSSMSSKQLQFRNRASEMFYWHKHDFIENSKAFWNYAKWPILCSLFCLVLSCIIFLLFMIVTNSSQNTSSQILLQNNIDDNNIMSANFSDERISLDFNDDINNKQILDNDYIIKNDNNDDDDDDVNDHHEMETIYNNDDRDEILTIFMNSPKKFLKQNSNLIEKPTFDNGVFLQEIDFELDTDDNENNNNNNNNNDNYDEKIEIIQKNYGSTTRNPLNRNTKIMKFTTQKGFKPDENILLPSTTETLTNEYNKDKTILSPILPPTKETLQVIGFTSGHQNNFGVPIEEDERILRLLNEEINKYESQEINSTTENPNSHTTTTTTTTTVKVSPTLPLIIHHKDTSPSRFRTTTESMMSISNASDSCESTSLNFCQGVLRYDLTTAKSKRKLESMDLEHFKYLIESNCSNRAAEFICSVLEPECRSAKLGSLQPCKRICKSILEPCSGLISSSEILTITFDCDRYPDSSDRNVCEDPTRRDTKCYDNEFQCLDSTCIPKQWKCDNIKDCPLGEDEDTCHYCHHDQFQCQSDGKCITEQWHCDGDNDCIDGSDEIDCEEYDDDINDEFNDEDNINDDDYNNSKIYNLFSDQIQEIPSDHTNSLPFLTISADDKNDENSKDENLKYGNNEGLFGTDSIDSVHNKLTNLTNSKESTKSNDENEQDEEIQTGEASGRIIIGMPLNHQGLGNFQDSKEIMMTSDSENDFKYSKVIRSNGRTRNGTSSITNKRISSTSGSTTVRTPIRLSTLLRRGTSTSTTSTTTTTTTTTTAVPIPMRVLKNSSTTKSRKTTLPTVVPSKETKESTLCPGAQLRCVSGKCITVDQLCDKIIDCPDGADEARCVYKENDEINQMNKQ